MTEGIVGCMELVRTVEGDQRRLDVRHASCGDAEREPDFLDKMKVRAK